MATHSSVRAWRIPVDRGAWRATVHGVAKSQARLSNFTAFLSRGFVGDVYLREHRAGLDSFTSGSRERDTWWLFSRWFLRSALRALQEALVRVRRRRSGWLLAHNHQGCAATSRRCEECGGRDGSPLPHLSGPFHMLVPQLLEPLSSSTAVPRHPRGIVPESSQATRIIPYSVPCLKWRSGVEPTDAGARPAAAFPGLGGGDVLHFSPHPQTCPACI